MTYTPSGEVYVYFLACILLCVSGASCSKGRQLYPVDKRWQKKPQSPLDSVLSIG